MADEHTSPADKSEKPAPAEAETECGRSDADASETDRRAPSSKRSFTVTASTAAWTGALVVSLATAGVCGYLYSDAKSEIAARDDASANAAKAERIASDYAVGAATVDYRQFGDWISKLKAGTSTSLATKFDATTPKLEQILTPLRWASTATPITAKVMSTKDGVYQVNVFLNVNSSNAQSPDGTSTTVTYNVSVDQNADWKIIDVGGLDGALPN